MALRVVLREGGRARTSEAGEAPELGLTFDTPRLVIGRGDGCDVRLPDPSVSHRHASIRQRGAEYILVDEKSTNGTFIGKVSLPPHSPRVLRSGELVRIGRVWLEVRIELGAPPFATAAAARELALELVTRGLAAQGEEGRPRLTVTGGPDAGKELLLADAERRHVIGRGKDVDLQLDDPDVSRRHVAVARKGDGVVAQDLGSQAGSTLDDAPLGPGDTPWKPGQILALAGTRVALRHAAAEALAELERSPDEKVPRAEEFELPAPDPETPAPPEADGATADPLAPAPRSSSAPMQRSTDDSTWGFTDAAVVLVALGVLALSIAGLVWLLRG